MFLFCFVSVGGDQKEGDRWRGLATEGSSEILTHREQSDEIFPLNQIPSASDQQKSPHITNLKARNCMLIMGIKNTENAE